MREIKFIAWDSFDNIMRDTKWLQENDFAIGVDGRMVVKSVHSLILRDRNMIPLQYTGLKDRNGKEIYEGDIYTGAGLKRIRNHIKLQFLLNA